MVQRTRSRAEVEAYSAVIDEIRRKRRRNEVGTSPSMPDGLMNFGDLSPEAHARGAEVGR